MKEEQVQLSMMDENGHLKDKEQFLNEVNDFYDTCAAEIHNCDSFIDAVVDPEEQVDVESALSTFEFYERSIYLVEEITSEIASLVFELVNFWNRADEIDGLAEDERTPIKIYINTPGGDLDATLGIIGTLKASKTPIHTIVIGTSYSGGFFIGICGDKRFGYPYSSYLFHEGSSMDGGDSHKFLQHVEFYKKQLERLKEITINNTKITKADYEVHSKDDWFFDTEDALKYGIIDKILTKEENTNE